jgi:hypothetical protein
VARVAAKVTTVRGRVGLLGLGNRAVAARVLAKGARRARKDKIDASGCMDFVVAIRLRMCVYEILGHRDSPLVELQRSTPTNVLIRQLKRVLFMI